MKVIVKDITTIDTGIIGHQCNCRGVMGSGVALAIKNRWPKAYDDYRTAYHRQELVLGRAIHSYVDFEKPLVVSHLCGQNLFGKKGLYTDYTALYKALEAMKNMQWAYQNVYSRELQLYLPYGIGCGLAGGDWKIVEPMIEKIMPDVILCKWGV